MKRQNNKSQMETSEMYCTECGQRNIPIPRKKNQMREPGHLKIMYCVHCNKETNMVEIKPYNKKYNLKLFKLEFNMGNFKDGQRVISLSDFKQKINNINEGVDNDEA